MTELDFNSMSWTKLLDRGKDSIVILNMPPNLRSKFANDMTSKYNVKYSYIITKAGYAIFKDD